MKGRKAAAAAEKDDGEDGGERERDERGRLELRLPVLQIGPINFADSSSAEAPRRRKSSTLQGINHSYLSDSTKISLRVAAWLQ